MSDNNNNNSYEQFWDSLIDGSRYDPKEVIGVFLSLAETRPVNGWEVKIEQ